MLLQRLHCSYVHKYSLFPNNLNRKQYTTVSSLAFNWSKTWVCNNMGEFVNQSEWLENTAQCEAVFCALGGQTETTPTGWTCKVKNAYKTMVMEDLREDIKIHLNKSTVE
jgi:hypothetical protein